MFFWRRKVRERDLERELQSDLELEASEQGENGLSPEDARDAAKRAFGNTTLVKEEVREMWGWVSLERFWQDLRYAARMLHKSPGFTAIGVLSLALGIGANTSVFSVLDSVLLKSLPVRHPEQLRILTWIRHGDPIGMRSHSGYAIPDDQGRTVDGSFSYAAYEIFRNTVPQFSDLVAFAQNQFTVTDHVTTDLAFGHYVSGNYFTGLGAQPLIGRPILPADDAPGKPGVAVLTHLYWSRRFASDPSIVGRAILVNREPVTVVGVMPPSFQGLMPGRAIDLFVPISMVAETAPTYYSLTAPDIWWVQIFGRLKRNASEAAATAAVQAALARHMDSYTGATIPVSNRPKIVLEPGNRGVGLLRGSIQTSIYILATIAGLVLFIACVNLANLLLARHTARAREIAIRISLGAGRWRLVRHMLAESMLLAGMGGIAGLLLARPMLRLLLNFFAGASTLSIDARVDIRALGFTFAVSVVTALLFGTMPAWRATHVNVGSGLKETMTIVSFIVGPLSRISPDCFISVARRGDWSVPTNAVKSCRCRSRFPNRQDSDISDGSRPQWLQAGSVGRPLQTLGGAHQQHSRRRVSWDVAASLNWGRRYQWPDSLLRLRQNDQTNLVSLLLGFLSLDNEDSGLAGP